MPNFPTSESEEHPQRTHWSVWRGSKWLGEHIGNKPAKGEKIKPRECLTSKTVIGFDHERGRILVK